MMVVIRANDPLRTRYLCFLFICRRAFGFDTGMADLRGLKPYGIPSAATEPFLKKKGTPAA
jgi:hypothetical protein